jgi:hypothetical protein
MYFKEEKQILQIELKTILDSIRMFNLIIW